MMTKDYFKEAMSHLATSVCMVTASHKNQLIGVTINSFISLSLEPCLILFTLKHQAAAFDIFHQSDFCSIHILAQDQQALSQEGTKRGGWVLPVDLIENGSLKGSLATFECQKQQQIVAGDHVLFIGEVIKIHQNSLKSPLIYHRRSYK